MFNNSNVLNQTNPFENSIKSNIPIIDKCVIYLFTPRKLPNHSIKPLKYNFTPQITENFIEKNIIKQEPITKFIKSDISKSIILPDTKGIKVNTSFLSDNWTFLIIVDGAAIPNMFNEDISNPLENELNVNINIKPRNIRVIMTGYIQGEPVNPNTLNSSTPTFNPDAYFIITRKTIFSRTLINNISKLSEIPRLNNDTLSTSFSEDFYQINQNENLFILTPNIIAETLQEENQIITSAPFNKSLKYSDRTINSDWENPSKHMLNTLSVIKDSFDSITYDDTITDNRLLFADEIFDKEVIENLEIVNNPIYQGKYFSGISKLLDLDEFFQIPFSYLLNTNPDILIVNNTTSTQMSTVDTHSYITPETVYSYLLEVCIPNLLLKWNLAHISFTYDSYSNYLQILSIEGIDNFDQLTLERLTNQFIYNLQSEIFPFLKYNCGDFIINVSATIYGSSLINLQFYDFKGLGNEDYIEHVNTLGGITSNVIGTSDNFAHNGSALSSLIQQTKEILEQPIDFSNSNLLNSSKELF